MLAVAVPSVYLSFYPTINPKNEKKRTLDIINDIIEYVNLFQFIDTFGNINHALSISEFWTYDTNDKKTLPLVK